LLTDNQKLNFVGVNVCGLSTLVILLLPFGIQQFDFNEIHAQPVSGIVTGDKVVILNFDDGRKSQYTQAKPILDKYGFKATFYAVCNYLDNKKGYMSWKDIETLYKEGHDIGSHSMNHAHLEKLSKKGVSFEVAQSKKCFEDHGINATTFAYPFNEGSSDKNVINIIAKYYDLARTASSPITFLRCDGLKELSNQDDCLQTSKKGGLTYPNRYSIRGWSHDMSRLVNSYTDEELFDRFVKVVNSQSKYNKDGVINAIPIIIYHRAGDSGVVDYNTDLALFEKEMKYLHDNNFQVLTMRDLRFNEMSKDLDIKEFTTAKMTMVKAIPNATITATAPTMVKAIPNPTAIEMLAESTKNATGIVTKQPSNVALHDNATSIEIANKIIDAALFDSLNADPTLTNTPKNTTGIVTKQPSNVALHDNATSIEMANKLIDAASMASLSFHGSQADRGQVR
jgi:peptidoglycan/xylan/chitin deacetylase (PgdA/CDA1 family)